jgi:hypothetical protein
MSENTALWDRVCKTDPKHVKPITGKQYSGNSPKPYYIVRRLTEEFGPVGTGWGFDIVSERFERLSDHDVLHVAKVEFWYGADRKSFQQMGQTKAAYMTSKGTLLVDEDAPKKSVTDALVKCASYLGFAGDIFMGQWDDSKYVAALKKEFGEESELERDLKATITAVAEVKAKTGARAAAADEVARQLTGPQKTALAKLAFEVGDLFTRKGVVPAYDFLKEQGLNGDERTYLWGLMDSSKLRSALEQERMVRGLASVPPLDQSHTNHMETL